MKKIIIAFALLALISYDANAFTTKAKQAILIDGTTGTVLFEKDADSQMPPASMSKLMTVYMVLEQLANGSLSLDDEFFVSVNAWKKGGAATGSSTMFLKENSKAKVSDLLRGIIIQSGNDACIVVAENMYGSEGKFAEEMNKKAKELGLTNSHFKNSTGWPDEGHYMSARDIAKISQIIIEKFPEYYSMFSEKNFRYNKINQGNRNPLLYKMPGLADGLKTGHTKASGYGVAGAVLTLDKKRRLILVVNGLNSSAAREEAAVALVNEGLNRYDNYTAYKANQTVDKLPVFLGKKDEIEVVLDKDLVMTLPRFKRNDVKFSVAAETPVKAPIKKGDKLGVLMIDVPEMDDIQLPLYAKEDVDKKGYFGRVSAWFSNIF